MARIEVHNRSEYWHQWNQEKYQKIRDAQKSRGDFKVPWTIPLPGNRVLVIDAFRTLVDTEIDTFR